ncbi:cag, partial [Carabus blaptoides fortunei]
MAPNRKILTLKQKIEIVEVHNKEKSANKIKAKEIAESLGHSTFSASSGWLNKFRNRHNISFKAISGEGAAVIVDDVSSFLEKCPSLIKGYSPRDIYNADETGLYFRALPNKTLTFKKEKCVEDNAGSHQKDVRLKKIKILFLPPNCTSACQPLDRGIIKNFKTYYRSLILKHLLVNIEAADTAFELIKKITPLDAVYFAKTTWDQVTKETVQNCFRKAGFKHENMQSEYQLTEALTSDPEDDLSLNVLADILKNRNLLELPDNENLNNFYNLDEN